VTAVPAISVSDRAVLADLRRTRRRTRIKEIDAFEALYRVYVTAVVGGIAVWILSGLTGDGRVDPATVAQVRHHGAQVVGAAVSLAWAVGLRSGGRGGPLVIEAAAVRHVLMAPVERALVLRPLAWRQLRFGSFAGAVVGAIAGLLAFRRLPGPAAQWVGAGAATGVLAVAGALGLGMTVAGLRPGGATAARWVGGLLALGALGWSAADLATSRATSPATWLGRLAISPLGWRTGALIGIGVALAAVAAGVRSVGGSSIEAAERRASLVGQLRFAATLRDVRAVVVLRRQLSQELPRQRRPRRPPAGRRRAGLWPVWRRAWQGIVRFPALRVVRLAVLGAAAGAAGVGVWRGTTPLLAVAGLALYVAALDVVEPLAQDLDHPDRRDSYPMDSGDLYLRLLGPSLVVMLGVAALAVAVGVVLAGGRLVAWQVGGVVALPAAAAAVAAAATSVIQGPPPVAGGSNLFLPPEVAGLRAVIRTVWPPVLATVGLLPLLAARHPSAGQSAANLAATADVPVVLLVAAVGAWIRKHDAVHAWFRTALSDLEGGKPGSPPRF
jgi:hypothetical protein